MTQAQALLLKNYYNAPPPTGPTDLREAYEALCKLAANSVEPEHHLVTDYKRVVKSACYAYGSRRFVADCAGVVDMETRGAVVAKADPQVAALIFNQICAGTDEERVFARCLYQHLRTASDEWWDGLKPALTDKTKEALGGLIPGTVWVPRPTGP